MFRRVLYTAGRKIKRWGTSPVVTRRHRAMSSLRASATIIVLRVTARLSAVRARYHCTSALSFGATCPSQSRNVHCPLPPSSSLRLVLPRPWRCLAQRASALYFTMDSPYSQCLASRVDYYQIIEMKESL